jgi:hypothetical protein
MGNGIRLRADEVVQSVDRVGVDEAVACPPSSLDTAGRMSRTTSSSSHRELPFRYFCNDFKCRFDSFITNLRTRGDCGIVRLTVKPEDVERVF